MSAAIVPLEEKYLNEVRKIFFESSTRKNFQDEEEREAFFYKYLGFYLKHFPDLCFVALDHKVLGYIVGSPVSEVSELLSIQPHLEVFKKEFRDFPAHLHINCHVDSRGQGVGAKLVRHLEDILRARKIPGIHIMTGVDARNKNFYRRLGFKEEVREDFHGSPILLMGKSLQEN